MGLTTKQEQFIQAFQSQKYSYLMAAGTAGSGKSIVTIGLLHWLCNRIKNLRFGVIRKSEKNLKQTTIPSYRKIKDITKTKDSSVIVDMVAKYPVTGSEILFIWADITKDPDLDNVKGIELDGVLIEEANQIDKSYFEILKTRLGRWANKAFKPFIMLNMNPTAGWCKELFYDNYMAGTLPERYFFCEFDKKDTENLVAAGQIQPEYLDSLKDLPPEEYSRFVDNNWNYGTIPNQLISYEWYKNCCISEYFIKKTDRGMLALDAADQGSDNTAIARMHNNHIGWWEEFYKQDPGTSGELAIIRAQENNIKNPDVIIDAIGVGQGALSIMRDRKFIPTLFVSGEKPVLEPSFLSAANKRAEAHWLLREAFRKGEITVTHNPKFQKECTKATYSANDKVIKILSKEEMKKPQNIGWSPGFLDCASMLAHRYYTTDGTLQRNLIQRQNDNFFNINSLSRVNQDRLRRVQNALIGA